jgi:hypothetical protein
MPTKNAANERRATCSESMEGRTLLINKAAFPIGASLSPSSFAYQFMKFMLLFSLTRFILAFVRSFLDSTRLYFYFFSRSIFFALFAQNNNLYEKAFRVNIPKENCLETAFDVRESREWRVELRGELAVHQGKCNKDRG